MSPLIPSRVIGENEPLAAVFNKVIATREVNHKGQGKSRPISPKINLWSCVYGSGDSCDLTEVSRLLYESRTFEKFERMKTGSKLFYLETEWDVNMPVFQDVLALNICISPSFNSSLSFQYPYGTVFTITVSYDYYQPYKSNSVTLLV